MERAPTIRPQPKGQTAQEAKRLRRNARRRQERAMRTAVRARDVVCQDCGRTEGLQVHHITLRSRGGSHSPENGRLLCVSCHQRVHGGKPIYTYHKELFEMAWDGSLDAHDACPSLVSGGSSCLHPANFLARAENAHARDTLDVPVARGVRRRDV